MKNISLLSSIMKLRLHLTVLSVGIMAIMSASAFADDHGNKSVDIMPVIKTAENPDADLPDEATHPTLRMTPDKSELIRLDDKIGSAIVGNPLHISILAESSNTLIVVPKEPGATHFTILGKDGKVLMQRHVIVASPKQDYIRVKKVCMEGMDACRPTNVYYCPDMCHEIRSAETESSAGSKSASAGDDSGKSDDSGNKSDGGNPPDQ